MYTTPKYVRVKKLNENKITGNFDIPWIILASKIKDSLGLLRAI